MNSKGTRRSNLKELERNLYRVLKTLLIQHRPSPRHHLVALLVQRPPRPSPQMETHRLLRACAFFKLSAIDEILEASETERSEIHDKRIALAIAKVNRSTVPAGCTAKCSLRRGTFRRRFRQRKQ
jgi:hypothetical protein